MQICPRFLTGILETYSAMTHSNGKPDSASPAITHSDWQRTYYFGREEETHPFSKFLKIFFNNYVS